MADDVNEQLALDRRLDAKANWEYVRALERRVEGLETWRAAVEAVSGFRRWALPIVLSVVGGAVTVANIVLAATHHH